jgi:hypothetical protein
MEPPLSPDVAAGSCASEELGVTARRWPVGLSGPFTDKRFASTSRCWFAAGDVWAALVEKNPESRAPPQQAHTQDGYPRQDRRHLQSGHTRKRIR